MKILRKVDQSPCHQSPCHKVICTLSNYTGLQIICLQVDPSVLLMVHPSVIETIYLVVSHLFFPIHLSKQGRLSRDPSLCIISVILFRQFRLVIRLQLRVLASASHGMIDENLAMFGIYKFSSFIYFQGGLLCNKVKMKKRVGCYWFFSDTFMILCWNSIFRCEETNRCEYTLCLSMNKLPYRYFYSCIFCYLHILL